MSNAEQRQIEEINQVKVDINNTQSKQRKTQLYRRLKKLEKDLQIYRQLRYGTINTNKER